MWQERLGFSKNDDDLVMKSHHIFPLSGSIDSVLPDLWPANSRQYSGQQDHRMSGMLPWHLRHVSSVWSRNHSGSIRAIVELRWCSTHSNILRESVLGLDIDVEFIDCWARSLVLSITRTRTQGSAV